MNGRNIVQRRNVVEYRRNAHIVIILWLFIGGYVSYVRNNVSYITTATNYEERLEDMFIVSDDGIVRYKNIKEDECGIYLQFRYVNGIASNPQINLWISDDVDLKNLTISSYSFDRGETYREYRSNPPNREEYVGNELLEEIANAQSLVVVVTDGKGRAVTYWTHSPNDLTPFKLAYQYFLQCGGNISK